MVDCLVLHWRFVGKYKYSGKHKIKVVDEISGMKSIDFEGPGILTIDGMATASRAPNIIAKHNYLVIESKLSSEAYDIWLIETELELLNYRTRL